LKRGFTDDVVSSDEISSVESEGDVGGLELFSVKLDFRPDEIFIVGDDGLFSDFGFGLVFLATTFYDDERVTGIAIRGYETASIEDVETDDVGIHLIDLI